MLLTGFGIPERLRPLPYPPEDKISGSFACMTPEQTGRVDRAEALLAARIGATIELVLLSRCSQRYAGMASGC